MLYGKLAKIGWQDRKSHYWEQINTVCLPKKSKKYDASCIIVSNKIQPNTDICLAQIKRHKNVEVIFLDNGGKTKYSNGSILIDKFISTRKDVGAYKSRNIASVFADSDKLIFVDDDGVPCNKMISSLLDAHKKYDIVSCMGCCFPLTDNKWNYGANHYYFGDRPFPYFTNLEGCCCIDRKIFNAVGGWKDDLVYGGGGYELCYRMLKVQPDKRKYAYIPSAILYHDYTANAFTMVDKIKRQMEETKKRIEEHEDFFYHRDVWAKMVGREDLLIARNEIK